MAKRFLRRTVDGEEIVVDLEAGTFYSLNATAVRILDLWQAGVREPDAIAARLVEAFEVEPEVARMETERILAEARAFELLDEGV